MHTIYSAAGLAGIAAVIYCVSGCDWRKIKIISPAALIIILGFTARFALMSVNAGYANDINCFKQWADRLYQHGFSQIYFAWGDVDYTPGYMYVLYTLGALRKALGLSDGAFSVLIKLPPMLCDIITSCVIYRLALKKFTKLPAFFLGLAYALNPAVIIDSVIWGQVDSVHTMLLFASVLALTEERRLFSYICMGLAVLVKPQSFALSPLFIYDAVSNVLSPGRVSAIKQAGLVCVKVIAAVLAVFILVLPFTHNFDLMPIISRYQKTLSAYPYVSVNAYNLYTFLGYNWKPITEEIFTGFTFAHLGNFFLILISLFSFYILYKGRGGKSVWFICAGALFALTFMLSVKMHERYLYPALVFFLAAYVYTRDKRFIMFYVTYSALLFVNCADVLKLVQNGNNLSLIAHSAPFISLMYIVITAALVIIAARHAPRDLPDLPLAEEAAVYPSASSAPLKLRWHDWLIMALMTAIYTVIAFYNLGDTTAPQTAWHANANQYAVFELAANGPVKKTAVYVGARNDKTFKLSVSDDGKKWTDIKDIKAAAVFRWQYEDTGFTARYARVTSADNDLFIQEIAFMDNEGAVIPIHVSNSGAAGGDRVQNDPLISQDPSFLCDEQSLVPAGNSFRNSTYFDEIYHARTAYEFIHHLPVYEWTHPPLGKVIISWGIMLFGMTPFGWRFAGTLFGVFMLPAIYVFAKKMFRGSDWAFFAAILIMFDFMHFAQSRIATIDVFVTFFIIVMYYFMYSYYSLNFFEKSVNGRHAAFTRSLAYLLFCGIFTGLAVAAKWEGAYAMAGLPVLFFYTLYRRWLEYKSAKTSGDFNEAYWNLKYFPAYAAITLAGCLVFFIAVPAVIYIMSYMPYMRAMDHPTIIKNQIDMFKYHTELVSEHDYSSYWFQWPVMLRPIYYYSGKAANGLSMGITSFGNPAVWWTGIAAALYCISVASKKFNKIIFFLLIAYASQYLPWILVSRTTYIYHYFPSVPFVILLITFMFKDWMAPRKPLAITLYILLVILLFIMFYPALSGFPAPMWYINTFLKWMPAWSLS